MRTTIQRKRGTNKTVKPLLPGLAKHAALTGMECAERMKFIFDALHDLADAHAPAGTLNAETVLGLARIGQRMAGEYSNDFDVIREEAVDELRTVEGP